MGPGPMGKGRTKAFKEPSRGLQRRPTRPQQVQTAYLVSLRHRIIGSPGPHLGWSEIQWVHNSRRCPHPRWERVKGQEAVVV